MPKKNTGRAPIPVRRMGTEVVADRRTRRVRDRGAATRAAIEEQDEPCGECGDVLVRITDKYGSRVVCTNYGGCENAPG
jgi:hypothetical protein